MDEPRGNPVLVLGWTAEATHRASEWVRTLCEERQVSGEDIHRLDLCTQELVQNILDHGNPRHAPLEIRIAARISEREFVLEISDSGIPFDPRQAPPPSEVDSLEDMPVGGWGIHLVREFVDRWEYERKGGRNTVTLGFELKK